MFIRYLLLFLILNGLSPCVKAQTGNKTAPTLFEKTYLHTDRDVYAQGDTMWFKAYLVNGQDNKPVNSSGTLYVELLAPDSAKILEHEIIRLDNGLGNGDFTLADTLKPGNYRLRAYTNWMRNFGDNFVFEKEITILNTEAAPVAPDPKIVVKSKKSAKNKTAAATATAPVTASPAAAINKLPIVRFYPEGGSLVNGISSLVAVKAEDGYGLGIPLSGSVLASAGDTVARFNCDNLGMGLFAMLPIAGQHYQAVVNPVAGGLAFRPGLVFELPSALNKGLALQVKQTDSVIHAIIRAAAISDSTLSMTLKHTGKTILSQSLNLKDAQLTFRISTATLPEGISAITIYDKEGKPECERLVYIHHPNNKSAISIFTNKKIYQPKEKVNVQIDAPANSNLSMAVVDAGIVPEQADDIVSYLQLQSEVKGNIENARRYFDTTNVNRFKQLDLLLMTQGWRDFVWRRLADTAIRISYAAEKGITVSGRVRDEVLNKWLPGLNITLFANGAKGDKIFTATSDSLGRFHFDNLMLYGNQPIKLSAANDKGKIGGALWVDTIKPLPVEPVADRATADDTTTSAATQATLAKREAVINRSKLKGVTQLKEVTVKTDKKKFVRIPNELPMMTWGLQQEFNITPKDYEYNTLTWFLLNNDKRAFAQIGGPGVMYHVDTSWIIPDIVVNGVSYPYYMRMNYPKPNYQYPPIAELYFTMPMEKFKKVEVHQVVKGEEKGRLTYVIVLTTKGDALTDNPGSLNTGIEGYYQARDFYKPTPNAKPSINDYRSTINWEPNIRTNLAGKAMVTFYNAVPQTNVRVIVQGVTNTGVPLVATAGYAVE
jgi:hypothetical protein